MNIFKIFEDIEKADPEIYDRLDSRRAAFKNMSGFGKKVALSAIPLALGSMFQKAYGQTNNDVVDVLQFALTLEYLERDFYKAGLDMPTLIPAGAARTALQKIHDHEAAHVNLLISTLNSLNVTPVTKPVFDFSARGTFPTWNTDYQTFLTLAQAFEDTGVRAYKGQAGRLVNNDAILTVALQIHSVEARHAAHVRTMRMNKGWIEGANGGNIPAAAAAVYAGEDNVTHGAVADVKTVGTPAYSAAIATGAFDEPLTKQAVLNIAGLFIV